MRFPTATIVAIAGIAITGTAAAEPPEPPPYYAIENVRVVTGAGETLETATVLIGDGLIEAIRPTSSAHQDPPSDAWVIDGEGLTLFPGLIDSLTSLGLTSTSGDGANSSDRPGPSPGGSGSQPPIRGPEDRPSTRPWVNAADLLAADVSQFEGWRKVGFTSAMVSPEKGLFAGQAALINLGRGEPQNLVVETPTAQRVNLKSDGPSRSYPGSLMGVLSYIKQVLSDARHYSEVARLYRLSPTGRARPEYDRTLEPIGRAMSERLPFLMPAHRGPEIDRVLALAEEYEVELLIFGGQGAYERVAELKQAEVPVLVSLEWPEEEKDRDPDATTAFRTLYHRRLAPETPARLAAAGVLFAFYSDGISSTSELFEKLRQAIDAGLSDETALAALSSFPAAILGVEDRLGTIETGKIANLVLATDYPWAEDSEVKTVFVDGRKYDNPAEDEPSEAPADDVSGTWELLLETPRGSRHLTAELEMSDDGKVTGELSSERGDRAIEKGRMSGDLLTFKTTQTMGDQTRVASYTLTIEDEAADGSMSAGPMLMDLSGTRTAKVEAEEKSADEGAEDTEPLVTAEELEDVMTRFQGPARRLDTFAVTNARVYTVSGDTIDNGTVLVSNGKIQAVGAEVSVPAGTESIDANGGSLVPGIIDAHSHIAIEGGVNEGSLAVTSMVTIEDVIDPADIGIYRALAGGVTTANLLHGSANPIGGANAVIKLRWGADAEDLRFDGAMPGIKFALGENPKRSRSSGRSNVTPRYPATRMGVMDVIRQAFSDAREYQKEWQEYRSATADAGKKRKRQARAESAEVTPPRRDFKLERLVEILEGKRLVHSHCYRADEILQLMRLAEEFGFQIATLQHVLEGYKVADEIAAHGAGASTFSDWWGYKIEAYDAIPHNAALLTERGVTVSINSDSGEEMRHLNQEAGKMMKWGGLDEVQALALVTLNPAKQLRIDDRVGSIEVGKDADLVLYDGPPLSMFSVVQKTFVDGDLYFDLEADRERQASVEAIKARLEPPDDEEEDGEETEDEGSDDSSTQDTPTLRSLDWSDVVTTTCREIG